ncbi:MAG: hypothetical protein ACREHV_17460 [Rhizomicrobium sp.]
MIPSTDALAAVLHAIVAADGRRAFAARVAANLLDGANASDSEPLAEALRELAADVKLLSTG